MKNKALTPILVFRGHSSSNVMQFLQDVTNVVAGTKACSEQKNDVPNM